MSAVHSAKVTSISAQRFKLHPPGWYAWQMFPGYFGQRCVPYCSPIHVTRVEPLKSGKSLLNIDFFNALYAEGVQNFSNVGLRILLRARDYLVAEILYEDPAMETRSAVISHIEFAWLEHFCRALIQQHDPAGLPATCRDSVSHYLDRVFGIDAGRT